MERKRFQMSAATPRPQKRAPAIPKAADIVEGISWRRPRANLHEKLGRGNNTWFLAVDLETNDWGEQARMIRGHVGQFGSYQLCSPSDLEAEVSALAARTYGTCHGRVEGMPCT